MCQNGFDLAVPAPSLFEFQEWRQYTQILRRSQYFSLPRRSRFLATP